MVRIAIVGRPNVGKSTLFNRLAGRKLALVDDRPGVTRDRRFGTGRLGDLDLDLIDTAGFEDVTDESLEARMRIQTERALDDADIALFVIDAREGVTPLDEVFATVLRRRGKPVVLVANKAEGRAGDAGALEAFSLGFGEPVEISAEHGEGLGELYAAIDALRPAEDADEDEAADAPLRIAIVGRPNAGKSTLVNALIGEERLLTGPEAGITRDAIPVDWDWGGRRVRLVDTAGLRRKARVNEALEKLSTQDAIRAITFAEVVILVMDATHPFETQDLQIADLVEGEGRALVFVLAKWDLIEDRGERLKACAETAEQMLPQLRGAPLVALSAETGRGMERLMPAVAKAHADWSTKVKTSDLNTWLRLAVERHPPPMVAGKRVRPKYIAQTKARPPTFVLFASRAAAMPDSYRRYLINSIRQSFDLPGVPMRLTVKAGANPYAEGGGPGRGKAVRKSPGKRPQKRSERRSAPPSSRKSGPPRSAGRGPSRPRTPRS
jgi:GTP-binding protein